MTRTPVTMTTAEPVVGISVVDELLAALRLASPALPIGAFAYSQGLEQAVELGHVSDRATATDWILGVLRHAIACFDLPLLARLWQAWHEDDELEAVRLDGWVLAGRESGELQIEERHLGAALIRLLRDTDERSDAPLPAVTPISYVAAFALFSVRSGVSQMVTLASYAYAWLEHQVSAATRLVPLGQTDAQRILKGGLAQVAGLLDRALDTPEDEIGTATPGLAIASARHEIQHTRLFRS
jgi:urease accessory protein